MRPALRLFSQAAQHARITFFTRQGCQLCVNAEETLSNVWDKRPFVYEKIDVMTPEQTRWRNLYEFDTPVIHIAKSTSPQEDPALSGKAKKLMHRFTAEEVEKKVDEVLQE